MAYAPALDLTTLFEVLLSKNLDINDFTYLGQGRGGLQGKHLGSELLHSKPSSS